MSKKALLFFAAFLVATVSIKSQTTVFYDDFNRVAVSPGGTPSVVYTQTNTGSGSSVLESTLLTGTVPYLKISSGSTAGRSMVTAPLSTVSASNTLFNQTLSSNTGLITWSFNIRHNRGSGTTLGGFGSGSYGIACVLAASDTNFMNTGASGYAVVEGAPSSGSVYHLVKFTGGLILNSNVTTLVAGTLPSANFKDYMGIKVTYDPATNSWKYYERVDGPSATAAFADPTTINETNLIGSATDNSYTSTLMKTFGFMWNYSTTTGNNAYFDNFRIAVSGSFSASPSSLTGFNYATGAGPSASQSFALSGSNLSGYPGNITVTGSTNYEVSTDNSTFSSSVQVPYTSGSLSGATLYVRMKTGLAAGNYTENIVVSGAGCANFNYSCSGIVSALSPTLNVSPVSLSGFNYIQGVGPSASQSYSLSGSALTGAPGNITVTGSSSFEVSTDNTAFSGSVNVPYSTSTLSPTSIYVRLKAGLAGGSYNAQVISNSGGGATVYDTCSGTVNVPALPVTPSSLSGFTYVEGLGPSASQSFTFTGSYLSGAPGTVVVTGTTNYEVSTNNSTFSSSVSYSYSSSTLTTKTVYVRLKAGAVAGTYNSESVSIAGGGASNTVTCNGSVAVPSPVLLVSPSTLTGFSYDAGFGPSSVQSYALSGVNLTGYPGNLSVAGSTDYEVSSDSLNFSASVNIPYSSGTLASTKVYVRLKAGLAGGSYNSENIANSGGGATAVNVACSGSVASAFVWQGGSNGDWQVAANWNPNRTTPSASDIIEFNGGSAVTVTNVPTQSVAKLFVINNSAVTLQAAAAVTLTIAGSSGTDLTVSSGSSLNLSGTSAIKIVLSTGATGSIGGSMTFSEATHTFAPTDASSVTFSSGSSFTQATGCTGNVFLSTGTANAVIFAAGSVFISRDGGNPFGLSAPASRVVFQTGSTYRHENPANPSISNRTYSYFVFHYNGTVTYSSGSNPCIMDSLAVTLGKFNLTSAGLITINGNLSISEGAYMRFNNTNGVTFNANPALFAITVNGTLDIATTFTNFKTPVYGAHSKLALSGSTSVTTTDLMLPSSGGPANMDLLNTSGVTIHAARTISGVLTLGGNNTYTNLSNLSGYSGLVYSASVAQTTGTELPSSISYLGISNSSGVTLGASQIVTDSLILSGSKLYLANHDLALGESAKMTGSSTGYVVTAGTGQLKKSFGSAQTFTFPVGDNTGTAEYSPVTVAFSSGTFAGGSVGVKVTNAKHPSNTSLTSYLNRYWSLTSSGISGFSADVKMKFVTADIAGTRSAIYSGRYESSSWNGGTEIDTVISSDTLRVLGVSSFGDFTGGEMSSMGFESRLNLTVIPEAYYDENTNHLNSSDTVEVFLADATSPFAYVDTSKALIDMNTFTGTAKFSRAVTGTYYIVVKGRSFVETWSRAGGESLTKGSTITYDMTAAADRASGSNMMQKGSRWCIYCGDVNQDGAVEATDLLLVDTDNLNFVTGYTSSDVNGDGQVEATDLLITDTNNLNFVSKITPGGKMPEKSVKHMSPKQGAIQK